MTTPHPLRPKEPEIPDAGVGGPAKYPALAPRLSIPGVSHPAENVPVPPGRWMERLRRRLGTYQHHPNFKPYVERADERTGWMLGEIQQTTGYCGPIATTQVTAAAKLHEVAEYLIDHADMHTKQGRSELALARALLDTSRLAFDGALKTSMLVAAARRRPNEDPLDAYMTADASDPSSP